MNGLSKRITSLILAVVMILSGIPSSLTSTASYAQDVKWIKSISINNVDANSKVVPITIDYQGQIKGDNKRDYIIGFDFKISLTDDNYAKSVFDVQLLESSQEIIKVYNNEGRFEADGSINLDIRLPYDINLENIVELSLEVYPEIKKEFNEDITVIEEIKSNDIAYYPDAQLAQKYKDMYFAMTDEQKKEFSNFITSEEFVSYPTQDEIIEYISKYISDIIRENIKQNKEILSQIEELYEKAEAQNISENVEISQLEVADLKKKINENLSANVQAVIELLDKKAEEILSKVSSHKASGSSASSISNPAQAETEQGQTKNEENAQEQSQNAAEENKSEEKSEQEQIKEEPNTENPTSEIEENQTEESLQTQESEQKSEEISLEIESEDVLSSQSNEQSSVTQVLEQSKLLSNLMQISKVANVLEVSAIEIEENKTPLALPKAKENYLLVYSTEKQSEPAVKKLLLKKTEILGPKITIARDASTKEEIYSGEAIKYRININNQMTEEGKESQEIEGAYITIEVDSKYLNLNTSYRNTSDFKAKSIADEKKYPAIAANALQVPSAEIVNKVEYEHNYHTNGKSIAKVYLNKIQKTTDASFLVDMLLENRFVPSGYKVSPIIRLYDKDGNELAVYNEKQDVADATLKVKYDTNQLYKSVLYQKNYLEGISRDSSGKYTKTVAQNRLIYIGATENNKVKEDGGFEVEFYYSLTSSNGIINTDVGLIQSYGEALKRVRAYDEIVIVEDLYQVDDNGDRHLAVFDSLKNPGWTVVETDAGKPTKVSYVVKSTTDSKGNHVGADKNLESVKLVLKFTDFNADLSGDDIDAQIRNIEKLDKKYKYTSGKATAKLTPVNYDASTESEEICEDDIKYILTGHTYSGTGMFRKSFTRDSTKNEYATDASGNKIETKNLDRPTMVDDGGMHLETADFVLVLTNNKSFPLTDVVIKDFDYDDRMYVKDIRWEQMLDSYKQSNPESYARMMAGFDGVYGIRADGSEVKIIASTDDRLKNPSDGKTSSIEPKLQERLLSTAAKVKDGTLSRTNVTKEVSEYTSIEFRMKPDFELLSGETIRIYVQMGFTDPYTLISDVENKNTLRNKATFFGSLLFDNGQKVPLNEKLAKVSPNKTYKLETSEYTRLYKKLASSEMTSKIDYKTGAVGETVQIETILDLRSLPKNHTYNNPYLVLMLPEGLSLIPEREGYDAIATMNAYGSNGMLGTYYEGITKGPTPTNNQLYLKTPATKEIEVEGIKYTLIPYDLRDITIGDIKPYERLNIVLLAKINNMSTPGELMDVYPMSNTVYSFFYADNLGYNLKVVGAEGTSPIDNTVYDTDKKLSAKVMDALNLNQVDNSTVMLSTNVRYKTSLPTKVESEKYIKTDSTEWTSENEAVTTGYDTNFKYRITINNNDKRIIDTLMIYDLLPYAGDTNVSDNKYGSSKFSNILAGKVTSPNANIDNFDVYYYIGASKPAIEPTAYIKSNKFEPDSNWTKNISESDYSKVKAIFIVMKDGKKIEPSQKQHFEIPMKTPKRSLGNLQGQTATNSFKISNNKIASFGKSNYVTNKISDSVINIKYKDITTGEDIKDKSGNVYEEQYFGEIGKSYNLKSYEKTIDGYRSMGLMGSDIGKDVGTSQEGEITITYWYHKQGKIKVEYVEVDKDGNLLSKQPELLSKNNYVQIGDVGTKYATINRAFANYRLAWVEGSETGEFKEKEQTVTYNYVKQGTVKIRHILLKDEDGNILKDSNGKFTGKDIIPERTVTGNIGSKYSAQRASDSEINPDSFKFVRMANETDDGAIYSIPSSGVFEEKELEIIYLYEAKKPTGDINVIHKLADGTVLKQESPRSGVVGESYTTSRKSGIEDGIDYDDYEAVIPSNASGTFKLGSQDVIYTYTLKDGKVEVKHVLVDKDGNIVDTASLADKNETITQKIGSDYTTSPYSTDNTFKTKYRLVNIDGVSSGKITRDTKTVTYRYIKQGTVTIRYVLVDKDGIYTSNKLAADKVYYMDVGKTYDASLDRLNITGYDHVTGVNPLHSPVNVTVIDGDLIIEYGYTAIQLQGDVKVVHKLADGTVLKEEKFSGNIDTNYTTQRLSGIDPVTNENYNDYDVVIPINSKGKYSTKEEEVVFVYTLKDGSVSVKYVEVDENGIVVANAELSSNNYKIDGKVRDNYTADKKVFAGYDFVKLGATSADEQGKITVDTKEVVYEYTKNTTPTTPGTGGTTPTTPGTGGTTPTTPGTGGTTPTTPGTGGTTPTTPGTGGTTPTTPGTGGTTPTTPGTGGTTPTTPGTGGTTPTTPGTGGTTPTTPRDVIRDIPTENPPTNVSFAPNTITNTNTIPAEVTNPVFEIIDENNTPLGAAIVDVNNGTYTFIEEDATPLGTAKIHSDNTLEIVDAVNNLVGARLPKTGDNPETLYYLIGALFVLIGFRFRRKK